MILFNCVIFIVDRYGLLLSCHPYHTAVFQRLYIFLGPLKKGFLEGCRPFVGLDGCFLEGPTGVLLTIVGCDANGRFTHLHILWLWLRRKCTNLGNRFLRI